MALFSSNSGTSLANGCCFFLQEHEQICFFFRGSRKVQCLLRRKDGPPFAEVHRQKRGKICPVIDGKIYKIVGSKWGKNETKPAPFRTNSKPDLSKHCFLLICTYHRSTKEPRSRSSIDVHQRTSRQDKVHSENLEDPASKEGVVWVPIQKTLALHTGGELPQLHSSFQYTRNRLPGIIL